MAKSFKENPALQFLSTGRTEEVEAPKTENEKETEKTERILYKNNPLFLEKKTKRVQLVLQPSLYERVKKAAQKEGKSLNEFVHDLLDQTTKEEINK